MEPRRFSVVDGLLAEFGHTLFQHLPRADQRRWAEVYLHGLINVPGRKSIRNIAHEAGVDSAVQALQQFVNKSPWDWRPLRREITRYLSWLPARAWTIEQAVIPKRGDHSVGVERRYVTSLGRTLNCQVGIGLYLVVGGGVQVPVDWRLLLSNRWTMHEEHRTRGHLPGWVTPQTEHGHILGMLTTMSDALVSPPVPVLVNLASDASPEPLLGQLAGRGVDFVAEVPGDLTVAVPPYPRGPAATGSRAPAVLAVRDHLARSADSVAESPFGDGVRLVSARAQLATARGWTTGTAVRLLGGRPCGARSPERYWITSLADRPMADVTNLISLKLRAEREVPTAQGRYGVRDFEGRSFRGWHHHMTLVSAAHALETLRRSTSSLGARQPDRHLRLRIVRPDACVPT